MEKYFEKEECKNVVKKKITNIEDDLFDYCFTIVDRDEIDILQLSKHLNTQLEYVVNTLYLKFKENEDYITHPLFVITYQCLLRLCAIIDNEQSRLIMKYCIQINAVTRKKLYSDLHKLEVQLVERAYEEKPRNEIVYIAKEFTQRTTNIHKIGITDDKKKRESSMNTSHSQGISIIFEKKVTNKSLVEHIVHKILAKYHYSKEFFSNKESYSQSIIHLVGEFISTLDSSWESISHEDLVAKIIENISKPIDTECKSMEQQDQIKLQEVVPVVKLDANPFCNFVTYRCVVDIGNENWKIFTTTLLAEYQTYIGVTLNLTPKQRGEFYKYIDRITKFNKERKITIGDINGRGWIGLKLRTENDL
jgi:hypothetical protein